MKKAMPFALLIGVGAGLVIGDITTKEWRETHPASSESSVSAVSVAASAEGEPVVEEPAIDEDIVQKNVEAGEVDMLDVAEEAYYRMTNLAYPRNDYDPSAFTLGANGQMTYTDTAHYTSRAGIDVSEHNGEIDWQQVADAGYTFAFIRLGYRGYEGGKLFTDAYFEQNLAGAQAAGLDVGVYFFAQAIDEHEAEEEAAFVLEQLAGRELQLPVMYDPEAISFDEARTDDITGRQFTQNTLEFCEAVAKGGYETGYYANLRWEVFMMDMAALEDYTVWYAGYESTPKSPYTFSFWQYSDTGIVPGISENTDLNIQLLPAE